MILRVLLTGTAVAVLALAQGPPGGGGMGGDPGGGGGGMGGGMGMRVKQTKADLIANRLKLNKDQTGEFQTILQAEAKENDPVIKQLATAKAKLATVLINGKTGADLEAAKQALADAQFQMTGVEVRVFQRVLALLKPNQTAKAPEAFDLMADIFAQTPSSGGGMRGGGMPGGGMPGGMGGGSGRGGR